LKDARRLVDTTTHSVSTQRSRIRSSLRISGGLHFQRANTIPRAIDASLITDNFAVLRGASVLTPVSTGVNFGGGTGFLDFVDGRGGSLQRNFFTWSGLWSVLKSRS
jgi:hypothetical protein